MSALTDKVFLVIDNSGDFPRIELQTADDSIRAYVEKKFITDAKPGDFVHFDVHMGQKIFIALGTQWRPR